MFVTHLQLRKEKQKKIFMMLHFYLRGNSWKMHLVFLPFGSTELF